MAKSRARYTVHRGHLCQNYLPKTAVADFLEQARPLLPINP